MGTTRLDINSAIDIVASVIAQDTTTIKVITEHDNLEVRIGTHQHDMGGPHLEPFGRVTMQIPSGVLAVTSSYNENTTQEYRDMCGSIMQNVADALAKQYEVAYVAPLTPEHIPPRKGRW